MSGPEADMGVTPEMTQAVNTAIVQSGASGLGPSTPPPPTSVQSSSGGGADAHVDFHYVQGSDGKLYGGDGKPPAPRPTRHVRIRIRMFKGRWLVSSEITHAVQYVDGTGIRTDSIGMSGVQSGWELPSDQNIGWNDPNVRPSDIRNEERFIQFLPTDLLTAVRQSLWSLQAKGQLYQFNPEPSPPDFPSPEARMALAAALLVAGVVLAALSFSSGATETPPAPSASPGASSGPAATVGDIVATAAGTQTTYTISASAPAGITLTYRWSNTNSCGTQTGGDTARFVWDHVDRPGGCPAEPVHPASISVVVSAGPGASVTRTYNGGSGPGQTSAGQSTLRPSAAPPANAGAQATAKITTAGSSGGGPDPLRLGGGVVLAAAGAGIGAHTLSRRGRAV